MHSIATIVLLVFVTHSQAQELAATYTNDSQDSMETLVDKLVSTFFNRAREAVPLCSTDLDNAMLRKAGHLAMSPRTSLLLSSAETLHPHSSRLCTPGPPALNGFQRTYSSSFQAAAARDGEVVSSGIKEIGRRAAVATVTSSVFAPLNTQAIYNKGDVLTDPSEALATILASKLAIDDLIDNVNEFSNTCPAPTFPCDLSILLKKSITRISGPLGRSFPAVVEKYGGDNYIADDVLREILGSEGLLKDNNARVKVDYKGPVANMKLAETSLAEFLKDIPPEALEKAQKDLDACDKTVSAKEPGPLYCRLVRAIAQKLLV